MKQILALLSILFYFLPTFSQTSHVEINLLGSNGKKMAFGVKRLMAIK